MRDIAHEQIAASAREQLLLRLMDIKIHQRNRGGLLPQSLLAELHKIESELYCRRTGIQSEPWVTHVGRGA